MSDGFGAFPRQNAGFRPSSHDLRPSACTCIATFLAADGTRACRLRTAGCKADAQATGAHARWLRPRTAARTARDATGDDAVGVAGGGAGMAWAVDASDTVSECRDNASERLGSPARSRRRAAEVLKAAAAAVAVDGPARGWASGRSAGRACPQMKTPAQGRRCRVPPGRIGGLAERWHVRGKRRPQPAHLPSAAMPLSRARA